MADQKESRVAEAPQTFRRDALAVPAGEARANEGRCYRAKVFKSGNSLALRLPARLGLEAGMEMELRTEPDGGYGLRRVDAPRRKIDVGKFAGKSPWLEELPRHDFEDSPRDWPLLDSARRPA